MSESLYPEFHPTINQFRPGNPRGPSRARYEAMLRAEAEKARIPLRDVLGRSRERKHCYVRFRVWRDLQEMGCSLPGIGRAAQRNHASILLGIRRIESVEPMAERSKAWMAAE